MSLAALLVQVARRMPNALAVSGNGFDLSFGNLCNRMASIASSLRHDHCLQPGDRVLILMENQPRFFEILFGCWAAGLCAVPVNAKLHRKEVAFIAQNCDAQFAFVSSALAGVLADCALINLSAHRIVIADDHTIMREGLKRILQEVEDIEVVGEAVDGFEVLATVRKAGFDLLLMDLSMPGRSGVDLIRQIKDEAPKLPILVLTMHEEEQYAVRAIRAGANGYLTKESAGTQLVTALRKVASGRPYISMEVAEQLAMSAMPSANNDQTHSALSDREFEVFCHLAKGKSITDIGEMLHLSVKTVSTHKTRIMQKMGLQSISELVQYAMTHHLLK